MTRRTIVTILVGILVAVLIGGLWLWFFSSAGTQAPPQGGTFGTGGDRTGQTQQTQPPPTNIPGQVTGGGQTAGQGGVVGGIGAYGTGAPVAVIPTTTAAGASWLSGGGTAAGAGGAGVPFTPATINQLNNGQVGGQVSVLGTFGTQGGGGGGGNGSALAAGLIAGTAVACTAFLVQGQIAGLIPSLSQTVPVNDTTNNQKSFMDCLMRTVARAALQQLTNSVVNWINSGFNGSPSFVTNYQQFFQSVADNAAGNFIANVANFAPFCTPFRNQIQIALARSYARRNTAPSCSLSQLLGTNIFNPKVKNNNGWSNLLQFTTVPANNPYGAYMSAQVGLQNAVGSAGQNANRNISPGGFLNFQQPYDCSNTGGGASVTGSAGGASKTLGYSCPAGCKCRVTTPGSTIEASLSKTLGVSQDTLAQAGISGSFDSIISALISQLMTRALYSGVSNLSGNQGYASYYLTPDQQAAQGQGQDLLTNLQGLVVLAQQYGQAEQGSIGDIQTAQQQLSSLTNCWALAASSTTLTAQQQNIAASNSLSAQAQLHTYDTQVQSLNDQITRANNAVAILQSLQTQTLNVGSTGDVAAINAALGAAQAQGQLIVQADLTQAQQDRTTLQTQLGSVNSATQTGLQQCNAFH